LSSVFFMTITLHNGSPLKVLTFSVKDDPIIEAWIRGIKFN